MFRAIDVTREEAIWAMHALAAYMHARDILGENQKAALDSLYDKLRAAAKDMKDD